MRRALSSEDEVEAELDRLTAQARARDSVQDPVIEMVFIDGEEIIEVLDNHQTWSISDRAVVITRPDKVRRYYPLATIRHLTLHPGRRS